MGLALVSVNKSGAGGRVEVGSYSYVHTLRAWILMLTGYVLFKQLGEDTPDGVIEMFDRVAIRGSSETWDLPEESSPNEAAEWFQAASATGRFNDLAFGVDYSGESFGAGDYGLTAGTEPWDVVMGLNAFVDHSDCGGWLSAGQVVDVNNLFAFLLPHIAAVPDHAAGSITDLAEFFEAAVKEGSSVQFR